MYLSKPHGTSCCAVYYLQYHKEVVRLMSGEFRQRIGERYIAFARKWMTYVLTKCESGRGTKPRSEETLIQIWNLIEERTLKLASFV